MVEILFVVFAVVSIGSAVGVVMSRNPVGSLLFMVACLASVAGIYVLMEAHFLAAVQVTVYAGAIMVLFLFTIMLLNLGHDFEKDIKGVFGMLLGLIVSGAIGGILVRQLGSGDSMPLYGFAGEPNATDAVIAEHGAVGAVAHSLFTDYVVPFELVGILLLVAIVGAIVLAKRAPRKGEN